MATDPETRSLPDEALPCRSPAEPSQSQHDLADVQFQLLTELDPELLRGVTLSTCISRFAKNGFGDQHSGSMYETERKLKYSLSFVVHFYHNFISHDWKTSGWLKCCALLLIFNSRAACCVSVLSCIPLGWAVSGDMLRVDMFTICLPYIIYLVFLAFWQHLRSVCCPLVVFLDRLCIAQHDPQLKEKGIMGLAAFLDVSRELTILWSPRYFTRLWCAYELATYLRYPDRARPVSLMPTAMAILIFLMAAVGMMVMAFYVTLINGDMMGGETAGVHWGDFSRSAGLLALFGSPVLFTASYVGTTLMRDVQNLPLQLSSFSIRNSECFCCANDHKHPDTGDELKCDRNLVFRMIRQWYGVEEDVGDEYLDRFDDVLRDRLSQIVLKGMNSGVLPFRHCFYLGCLAAAPNLIDAIAKIMKECCVPVEDASAAALRSIYLMSLITDQWLKLVAVYLLYVWLQMSFCKLGVCLAKRMPLKLAAALPLVPLLLSEALVWGCVEVSTLSFRSGGDFSIHLTLLRTCIVLGWFALASSLCAGCRWCCFTLQA